MATNPSAEARRETAERTEDAQEFVEVRLRGKEGLIEEIRKILLESGLRELHSTSTKPDYELRGCVKTKFTLVPVVSHQVGVAD